MRNTGRWGNSSSSDACGQVCSAICEGGPADSHQQAPSRLADEASNVSHHPRSSEPRGRLREAADDNLSGVDTLVYDTGAYPQLFTVSSQMEKFERQSLAAATVVRQRAAQPSPPLLCDLRSQNGRTCASPAFDLSIGGAQTIAYKTIIEGHPNIPWIDIIGSEDAKQKLREAIEQPLLWPQLYGKGALEPWRGILLFGPPGTGKTMLVKAAATQVQCHFFMMNASHILHDRVGQSERHVREIFAAAERMAPAIIFIDDCDSLLRKRCDKDSAALLRIRAEIFAAMGNFKGESRVQVICATNLIEQLDEAVLHRLERRIYVGPPVLEARARLFAHMLAPVAQNHTLTQNDFIDFARLSPYCTGADIQVVVKDAVQQARNRITGTKFFSEDAQGFLVPAKPADLHVTMRPRDPRKLKVRLSITRNDVLNSLSNNKPALSPDKLSAYKAHL